MLCLRSLIKSSNKNTGAFLTSAAPSVTMAEKKKAPKRKLTPVKGQQKLVKLGADSDGPPSGWLQEKVAELRKDSSDLKFNQDRIRFLSDLKKVKQGTDGVMYWMFRDQRVQDNWALIYAQQLALKENLPLHICFCLVPRYLEYTYRQYAFMLKGLQEVAKECQSLDIQFHLVRGEPEQTVPGFIRDWNVGALVTDFTPLRLPQQWLEGVKKRLPSDVPFIQVDAHNVVPCWEASSKLEYGARTIRGKIHKLLPKFLTEFPPVHTHPHPSEKSSEKVDWEEVMSSLEADRSLGEVSWARPGVAGGMAMLESFIDRRLRIFAAQRNDPNAAALSGLSPWFHSGQLSTQRSLLAVQRWGKRYSDSVLSFTEELLVRRELADNFCYYNPNYDNIQGAYDWAKNTLKIHAKDPRQYVYTRKQLENSETHDPLWNAAQRQLHLEGKMHGFMRMYWAKKILEWTASPEEALDIALYLNDRFALDGCDPNGYVGCMWSICGIHDQGWAERAVFGKVRYMNYAGCKRKFDVTEFELKYAAKTA